MKLKAGRSEIKPEARVFASVLAAALLSASASSARADIYTYTDIQNVSASDPATFQSFNIPQFSPAMGTLQNVIVTISGLVRASLAFTNWSSSMDGVKMQEQNTLSVLYNNSQTMVSSNCVFQTTPYPGMQPVGANGGVYTQSCIYNLSPTVYTSSLAADLASFTGPGNVPLAAGLVSDSYMTVSGGNYHYLVQTTGSETATVTYSFAPVPEPSAALLVGLGGLVICGVRGFRPAKRGSSV
jgi:hypothetical protein